MAYTLSTAAMFRLTEPLLYQQFSATNSVICTVSTVDAKLARIREWKKTPLLFKKKKTPLFVVYACRNHSPIARTAWRSAPVCCCFSFLLLPSGTRVSGAAAAYRTVMYTLHLLLRTDCTRCCVRKCRQSVVVYRLNFPILFCCVAYVLPSVPFVAPWLLSVFNCQTVISFHIHLCRHIDGTFWRARREGSQQQTPIMQGQSTAKTYRSSCHRQPSATRRQIIVSFAT